jgi:N-formylglutamate amidohydrolase
MTAGVYDLFLPDTRDTTVIFASPHSGRDYPAAFLAASPLDERTIRSSEDAYVDLLFAAATQHGAPLLAARAPRAYVDLNRAPEELDPALIEGVTGGALNPRVTSGLGVVPRVVANGRPIYRSRITQAEAARRIATVWRPYHQALQTLIDDGRRAFGESILIDCHSMPHEAIAVHARPGRPTPDVVLGDRFGATAAPAVTDAIEAAFADAGFTVARNNPFAGAYVTQAYGRPSSGQHVVQVEIDRALYLDEATVRPAPQFTRLQVRLAPVIARIAALGRRHAVPLVAE